MYPSDLLVFDLAAIDIAAASGDQHLATARVKILLAQSALTVAVDKRTFTDAGTAIELVRRVLTWSLMGSRDQMDWLTTG